MDSQTREPYHSSFKRGRKYRWNFVRPPNQNCGNECHINPLHMVDISLESDWDAGHKGFHMVGGKQYCWDSYLAPSIKDMQSNSPP